MNRILFIAVFFSIMFSGDIGFSQEDTTTIVKDSVNIALLESYNITKD